MYDNIIMLYNYPTQNEYLEETVLRAEVRGSAWALSLPSTGWGRLSDYRSSLFFVFSFFVSIKLLNIFSDKKIVFSSFLLFPFLWSFAPFGCVLFPRLLISRFHGRTRCFGSQAECFLFVLFVAAICLQDSRTWYWHYVLQRFRIFLIFLFYLIILFFDALTAIWYLSFCSARDWAVAVSHFSFLWCLLSAIRFASSPLTPAQHFAVMLVLRLFYF